ncbi:hypothetical protein EK904_000910, partial [Melospiza melodia maxima]
MAEGEITTFSALTEKFDLPAGSYKKPKLLYCSNGGHFLRILPDGTLQLSAESVGVVHIRSTQSGQYLAMDPNGLLYGSSFTGVWKRQRQVWMASQRDGLGLSHQEHPQLTVLPGALLQQLLGEECLFLERLEENHYNTYVCSFCHALKQFQIAPSVPLSRASL